MKPSSIHAGNPDLVVGVKTDQKMNVVFHTADRPSRAAQPSDSSTQVLMERSAPLGLDQGLAALGAENEVVMERKVGGSHKMQRLWHPLAGCSHKTRVTGGIISLALNSTAGYRSSNPPGSRKTFFRIPSIVMQYSEK